MKAVSAGMVLLLAPVGAALAQDASSNYPNKTVRMIIPFAPGGATDVLGRETPLRSLELALEPNFVVGGCEGGYSCTYINTFSWASANRPLPSR